MSPSNFGLRRCMTTLSLFFGTSVAFLRTTQNLSPFDKSYLQGTGILNLTASQLPQPYINSWWTLYFISAENGHDYFIVSSSASAPGPDNTTIDIVRVSQLDITEGNYFGITQFPTSGVSVSKDTLDLVYPGLHIYSTSPDLISKMTQTSTITRAGFNLTSVAQGPNNYDAGSGVFNWGLGLTTEWSVPEAWVTGTITIDGKEVAVIPEKSMAWYDRQFGPGFGTSGWNLWIFLLDNGVKVTVWATNAVSGGEPQFFATMLFLDGHHEVYPVAEDFHPSVPFVSKLTNLTYYGKYMLEIPQKRTRLEVTLPTLAGEMTDPTNPQNSSTLFEGYSTFAGYFDNQYVTGWGTSEVRGASAS
ncbi:hypothetical protein B7463_g3733, partial [Scytalidium lignicola]